jgi:hypothetical protein
VKSLESGQGEATKKTYLVKSLDNGQGEANEKTS